MLPGTPVAVADQKSGTTLGITFEATRVSGPTSPPDFTNPHNKIHINNWAEVNLLEVTESHGGGGRPAPG